MNISRACLAAIFMLLPPAQHSMAQDAKRGEYLAAAGGCRGCHTEEKKDAAPYAGGSALKTPFGSFFAPKIGRAHV